MAREEVAAPTQPEDPGPAKRRPGSLVYGVALIAVTAAISLAYLGRGLFRDSTWRGNIGDPEQFMWFLSYVPRAMGRGLNPLLTDYALYPDGANLMWNTSILLPAVLVSPVTLTLGPITAYNVLLVLAPIVTSATSFVALRRYVVHDAAAAVGALSFTFTPFFLQHATGHTHLVLLGLLPIFVLLLDEILARQQWNVWLVGGLLGLVCVAQLLTSEEILAIWGLVGAAVLLVLCALHPRRIRLHASYFARAMGAAVLVFAPLAAYPLHVQMNGPRHAPGAHQRNFFVADLLGFVTPVRKLIDFGTAQDPSFTGNSSEWNTYLGFPFLIAIVAAVVFTWRRTVVRVGAILLVFFAVLALGEELHVNGELTGVRMPWHWISKAPLIHDLLPGRLGLVTSLFAALLLAVFVDEVLRRRQLWTRLAGAALVTVIAVSQLPQGMATSTVRTPAFFTDADRYVEADSVVLVLPYALGPAFEHPMLWQAQSGMHFKMADGWLIVPGPNSGEPTTLSRAMSAIQVKHRRVEVDAKVRSETLTWLADHEVETVVVADRYYRSSDREAAVEFFTEVFGRQSERVAGVDLWRL